MTAERPRPAPLGFALVGTGVIARVIASALAQVEDAELRLVVGRRAEAAQSLAAEHGAQWSDDLGGYLDTPAAEAVDIVVVATPSGAHADAVVAALEAGKHVLVEKPIDISLEAADRITAAERRTGKVVGVVSQHRFDRSSEKVIDAMGSGLFGRPTSAIASCAWWRPQAYYDSSPWRGTWEFDGGGATMNQAIHVVDLLLAVMGDPVSVSARTGRLAHPSIEVEDTAVAVVEFASGALGVVHATTAAYPGVESSLRVFGDRGSAAIVDDRLVYFHAADEPGLAEEPPAAGIGSLGPAHELQLRDLIQVVRARQAGDQEARPRVGSAEGRRALALVLAIYESAQTGRIVALTPEPKG